MKHLRIFENFDDFSLDPMSREIFDVWEYVPLSRFSDEYRLRGDGSNMERARELAERIRSSKDYYARFKFAREGDDDIDDIEIASMVNTNPEFVNDLKSLGYVLVNKDGTVLAPK